MFEYCENKDLSSLLKKRRKLKEIEVQYYIYQLIQALIHLQERNIIHRDIKLENIFLTEKLELKLGDFGLARKLNYPEAKCYDFAGTPAYMAPEIFEIKPSYTLKADIWPIGVIMYQLLLGELPFKGVDAVLEEKIKNVN
jgi:polo-like kinase 1